MKIVLLNQRLKKEWEALSQIHSSKTEAERYQEFKKNWDDFQGDTINEFLDMPNAAHTEWTYWTRNVSDHRYSTNFNGKSLKQVWEEFKLYWELDDPDSKLMFQEMELLSNKMLEEWRYKYRFSYPHVYEINAPYVNGYQRYDFSKSKMKLWDEFKEIWEIDIENYNEDKYKKMLEYINSIECDSFCYRENYPRNFFDFRENANYHSYDSYSVIEQYEICEAWEAERN